MTFRENANAILHYEHYDRMPVVAFGYWNETVDKWADEGHITREEADSYNRTGDNGWGDRQIMAKLGFDFNWNSCIGSNTLLDPCFPHAVLEERPDGSRVVRDGLGLISMVKPGITSIPAMLGTTLTDRKAWEEQYLPRMQMNPNRVPLEAVKALPAPEDREYPIGLHLGSLMGHMRDMLSLEEMSILYVEDEDLYREVCNTICSLCYDCAKVMLETGVKFDYAHFWEDMACKNGPLVWPDVFRELAGPWYRKLTELVKSYGIDIVSVDCDGCIDKLVPIWLENGVNTMFPIEVGTWGASIAPWREKYGRELRGVGGMNKNVFSRDKAAVEAEVERLKPLMDLGGYIPCPDHRIAPDAKFELVQYYCDLMRKL